MINLIFTRKSLLAGVKAESADLLTFDENSHIEFGNRSMKEVLEDNIPLIVEKYSDHAKKNNLVLNGSIPATLVFPVETTSKEVHEIMHFVGSYSDVHFNIVHIDDLIQPFLHSQKFSKDALGEPMIVLEGLDDYLSVLYYFNTKEIKHQSFITFEEKQAENHGQHVIDALVKEFEKIGFSLNEDDKKELRYQHTLNNNTYFIQKSNGVATLSASVRKDDLVMDKSYSIDKYTLNRVLNRDRLEKLGIKRIVLLGEHLKEYGYPEYLNEELGLEGMVYLPSSKAGAESFLDILSGIENRTSSPFQPDLKVAEVLNLPTQEKDFLDLSKLNAQVKPLEAKDTFSLKPANKTSKQAKKAVEPVKSTSENKVDNKPETKAEETKNSAGLFPPEEIVKPATEKEADKQNGVEKLPQKENAGKKVVEQVATEEKAKPSSEPVVENKSEGVSPQKPASEQNKVENLPVVAKKSGTNKDKGSEKAAVEAKTDSSENTGDQPTIDILRKSLAKLAEKPLRDATKEVQKTTPATPATPATPVTATKSPVAPVVNEWTNQPEVKEKPAKLPVIAEPAVEEKPAPELKTETEAKTEVPAEKVQTVATSKHTGIEDWNRITEMEETLRKHEEEERKKFEMLKEKLALQRQQKATPKIHDMEDIPNIPRKNARSINLKEAFEFIKNFPEEEFITQMVLDKNLRAKKVLRFVSNADFAQSYIEYKFLRLYDKESRYYPGISGLYESEEGKFYMRNYYKGSTLAEYANKAGLAKKHSLKKLSSSDLEFIVKVIEEVSDSPVSHCNLHANNILVQEKGFWRFHTVEQIRLVGFTSDDCNQEDMLTRVHEIFHAILAPGVYSEFRNTLKL